MRLFEDCKCGKQREIPKYTRRYVFYLAYSYYPRKVDELQRRLRNANEQLEKKLEG